MYSFPSFWGSWPMDYKFSFQCYIVCWGKICRSEIIGGEGGCPEPSEFAFYSDNSVGSAHDLKSKGLKLANVFGSSHIYSQPSLNGRLFKTDTWFGPYRFQNNYFNLGILLFYFLDTICFYLTVVWLLITVVAIAYCLSIVFLQDQGLRFLKSCFLGLVYMKTFSFRF